MSITKIILRFLLFYILFHLLTKYKTDNGIKKDNSIEKYIEKENVAKMPGLFTLSDNRDYQNEIKEIFNLTNEDYKKLVELPSGSKVKIDLKNDWKTILNNQIDSVFNNIDIKFTKLGKTQIDSQFKYEISSNVNSIFEYNMDKYDKSMENLVNDEKRQYVLDNTDFNNLFEDKEFDYYKKYELNAKRYDASGNLIKLTDEPLNESTDIKDNFDEIYTYDVYCDIKNDENDEGNVIDINDTNNDDMKYGDDMEDYHKKYIRMEIKKPDEKPFKLVEYNDVTEGLVNNFQDIENIILSKLNLDINLFIAKETLENIPKLNVLNGFRIVDRKINYILKNRFLTNEYFYNGEIVIHRDRNHGIHIKIDALKQRNRYNITDFKILGIVINDKIDKLDTITENIMNPLYHKFKDRHVITKGELETELANIIDQGAIENYLYLFSRFKKFRAERGININDFELFVYTTKILMDVKRSKNFKKIEQINNPSIYKRIFG
tara:strand:- start:2436 stop:3908 length:1473 start_codon:yes stop_codon:yes gene_type:complete